MVLEAGPPFGRSREPAWYRVRVDERFAAFDSRIGELIVDPLADSSCATTYEIGKRYLFWGNIPRSHRASIWIPREQWPSGHVYTTMQCNWGRELPRAQHDVDFLRQHVREPQAARISGVVTNHGFPSAVGATITPPLASVALRLTGPSGELTGSTDEQGRFEFTDVVPGSYTLVPTFAGYRVKEQITIRVPEHGCGTAYVPMFTNGHVSGRVIRHDGTPAVGAEVEVEHADQQYGLPIHVTRANTNSLGRFTISEVPAGALLVKASPHRTRGTFFPITWWPGVTDRSQARVLRLKPNEHRSGLVIRLTKPADPDTIP
jgi:hypothetical protein